MSSPIAAEVFPAGDFLADELAARGWTQADFAEILGRPAQFVSEIISGKKQITRESAAQIAAALGTSPELWLNLQDSYLLWKQAQDKGVRDNLHTVATRARLRELAPISLLRKRGYLSASDPQTQSHEILDLFGMRSLDEDPAVSFAARRSNPDEDVTMLQRTWVACVRANARELDVPPFSPERFRKLVEQLSTEAQDPETFAHFQEDFAAVGVKLIYVEAFPGAKLDGCALIANGSPTIGISGRGKRLDKILFTLLHESAHILLGHVSEQGEAIVDDLSDERRDKEAEADKLASKLTISGPLPVVPSRPSMAWAKAEADKLDVPVIVLIGRLQNDGALSWKTTLVRDAPTVTDQLESWAAPYAA